MHNLTFRVINDNIPTIKELDIDSEMLDWFNSSSGFILVCGATGSGKSTTLASILRQKQLKEDIKIVTIEKPIEYLYPFDGKGYVVQREIPTDCISFEEGLTSAMRQAPNCIMIGEIRNQIETNEALRASETGHLALSTMHTINNVTTLNRIVNLYRGNEQKRILSSLGDTLRGIVNQVLVKNIDETKRFAVREKLSITSDIKKHIINYDFDKIRQIQVENKSTMEHKLFDCVQKSLCSYEEARKHAPDIMFFDSLF